MGGVLFFCLKKYIYVPGIYTHFVFLQYSLMMLVFYIYLLIHQVGRVPYRFVDNRVDILFELYAP